MVLFRANPSGTSRVGDEQGWTQLLDMMNPPAPTVYVMTVPVGQAVQLREPIALIVEGDVADGVVVVSDRFSTCYGAGESQAEAVQDYVRNLLHELEELEADEEILGDMLKAELEAIRRHVIRG